MLVLTRKSGQAIKIGESVTVTVVQLGRGRVRLGIAAPGEVSIHRGEIYDRIQEQRAISPSAPTSFGEQLAVEAAVGDSGMPLLTSAHSGGRRDSMSSSALTRQTAVLSGRS
jgi:carbon storage regulator